jgi:hypothetical protein
MCAASSDRPRQSSILPCDGALPDRHRQSCQRRHRRAGGDAEKSRVPFFAHVDEFQSFGTDAFASLMSEARKYGGHFCLSHQFTHQIAPAVRSAVLGNAGTLIVFHISGTDVKLLAPSFTRSRPMHSPTGSPFQHGCAVRRFPAISRSKPRRLWRSRADGWRLS